MLLDQKDTVGSKQFTVRVDQLDKIRQEAFSDGRDIGALLIVAGDGRRYYVFDARDLENMVE